MRARHAGDPSVETALRWFFRHIVRSCGERTWATATHLFWPRRADDDLQPYIGSPGTRSTRTSTGRGRPAGTASTREARNSSTGTVARVPDGTSGGTDFSTESFIALPFDLLETLPIEIPQYCFLGIQIVMSLMLPQGSGISAPASILQAAYQRYQKFSNPTIPRPVRDLMITFGCIYVDDSLV
jgi:hypothetical protein